MHRGYLTVYLSLVMGVLLSLFLIVAEGIRMHTIRTQTECVADMAYDSALAEFHRELLEQYDLFFIDMSYGTDFPSFANTEEHIRGYMNLNFRPSQIMNIPIGKDLTGLSAEEVILLKASVASDQDGAVLRKQAVAYMKDKLGISILEEAAANAGAIRDNGLLDSDVENRRSEAEARVKEAVLNRQQEMQEDEEWEGRDALLPSDIVNEARSIGILELALPDTGKLSSSAIVVSQLLSQRIRMTGTGLPEGVSDATGVVDRGLFNEYLSEKCGYYGNEKDNAALSYQMEYLFRGGGSDRDNLKETANRLLLIREAANVAYLFGDSSKRSEAETAATAVCVLLGLPELKDGMTQVILFAWAYAESVKDLRMLYDGERVPIMKSSDTWNTPFGQLLTFRSHLSEYNRGQSGIEYREYLQALLFLENYDTLTLRFMDICESDIRLTKGNSHFRMDACIDSFEAEASVTSRYGYHYSICRTYSYDYYLN